MIRILGLKRILWIVGCIVIMAAAGSGVYYYLMPQQEWHDGEIRKVDGQIGMKRAQIQQLKLEYAQLRDQIIKFNRIKGKGFFNAQDRVTLRVTIDELTRLAKLLKTKVELTPGTTVDNPKVRETGYSLISGPMKINVQSLDDISAYRFVVALQNIFPGYLEFKSLKLKRVKDLDRAIVKKMLAGEQKDPLITGDAEFVWWSMASQKQMAANPYFNPSAMPATTPLVTEAQPPQNGGTP